MAPAEPGRRLLHYELVEKLGEGGMGEVWKALDTALDREVAIKVLPDAFASDAQRMARFEREARLLGSLNHPNIATVYGLHEADAPQGAERVTRFIAMEFVPGEDLAQRLARGPMPPDTALDVARQIAEALEAAHERSVIHRDLKPANVRLTEDGRVKVLDFGLAKSLPGEAVESLDPDLYPTVTSDHTREGLVLGTAAYMSPEQARGRRVDRRSDVWAFGCLLYECLTGRKAFPGETVSDTLAAVLTSDPDWDALPLATPRSVRRVLRRCLTKDASLRLHDITDARLEFDDPFDDAEDETVASSRPGTGWVWPVVAAMAVVVAASTIVALVKSGRSSTHDVMRVSVTLPRTLELVSIGWGEPIAAISPDGKRLAFTARQDDTVRLYLRSLAEPEPVALPETENAGGPFFSPDGQWVGFFARGKLKKVSVQGGTPVVLCDAPTNRGGTWLSDGTIVFAPTYSSGLARVSADGGEPRTITTPDPARNERTHRWPHALPDDRSVLMTIGTLDKPGYYEDAVIGLVDLDTGEVRPLIQGGSIARYAPTGHVIYSREGSLLAVPFDAGTREVNGPPRPVLGGVAGDFSSGMSHFGIADDGTLFYVPAFIGSRQRRIVWVDRSGVAREVTTVPAPFLAPRLSPDGRKLAVGVGRGPGDGDIWIHDFAADRSNRLTFDGWSLAPLWSPDGTRIVYGVTPGGDEGLAWKAADGSDAEQMLLRDRGDSVAVPEAWLPDGRILYSRSGGAGGGDVLSFHVGDTEPEIVLGGSFAEGGVSLSPKGRWMVYASDESGRFEVYVRSYPGPGGRWQISTEGGRGPIWSEAGDEIFYTDGTKMMVVPVRVEPTFSAGTPRLLFQYEFDRGTGPYPDFDVAADGRNFLMVERPPGDPVPRQLDLVLNFTESLE